MREAPDSVDVEILETLEETGPITLSELSRTMGMSKGALWKRVRKLSGLGLIKARRVGGILILEVERLQSPPVMVKIGLLRASEYPYILGLARRLRDTFYGVKLLVYDEARRLAFDLARGRIHLAMAPLVALLLAHRLSGGAVRIVGGGSGGGASIVRSANGAGGHATTMSSSMELCAELRGLKGPRIYASSGEEVLHLLLQGRVEAAALWEPYAARASRMGFDVEDCGLPVCCLLGAHASLEPHYPRIARAMEESVSDASRGNWDPGAYAELTGLPRAEVEETSKHYIFLEDPPTDVVRKLWAHVAKAAVPPKSLGDLLPLHG